MFYIVSHGSVAGRPGSSPPGPLNCGQMLAGAVLTRRLDWAGCPRRLAHVAGGWFCLSSGRTAGIFNRVPTRGLSVRFGPRSKMRREMGTVWVRGPGFSSFHPPTHLPTPTLISGLGTTSRFSHPPPPTPPVTD